MTEQGESEQQMLELHVDDTMDEEVADMQSQQENTAPIKRPILRKRSETQVKDQKDEVLSESEYAIAAIRRAAARVRSAAFEKDSAEAAEVRSEVVKKHWERVNQLHVVLMKKANAKRKTELNIELAEIEEEYLYAMGELATKIQQGKRERSAVQSVVQMQVPFRESEVRNTWGEFDGNIKKWPGFRDRFMAAVHNNADISPAYKFQHLSRSMVGKAALTLGEWQLTADNYQLAWDRMLQLYNNKNVICRELLRSFFKLPVLTSAPRANELQRMSNVTHETIRQLKAQGVPVEHWDVIIVHILQERLDPETGKQWELQRPNELPTVEQMLNFIDHQAAALATTSSTGRERGDRPSRTMSSVVIRPNAKPLTLEKEERQERSMKKMPCTYCSSMHHPVWECPGFQSITLHARKEFALKHNLCFNCLKSGHKPDKCYQGPCQLCKTVRHNSLLCSARYSLREEHDNTRKRKAVQKKAD